MDILQLELEKKVDDGSIVIEGSSDILTMALGTAKHSGHVRGLGFGVKPTTYFNLPRRGSRRYSEVYMHCMSMGEEDKCQRGTSLW